MQIVIKDFKLPSWNKFYSGVHWAKRKQIVDEAHELVVWAVYQVKNKPELPIKKAIIVYEIYYKDKRRHDVDNCAVKLITDGLVKAGVFKDDNYKIIPEITIRIACGKTDKVVINIEEI